MQIEVIQCFCSSRDCGNHPHGKLCERDEAGREPGKKRICATVLPPEITLYTTREYSVSPSVYLFPPWKWGDKRERENSKRKVNENWLSSRFRGCLARTHTDSWLSIKIHCAMSDLSPTGFLLSGAVVVLGGQWLKQTVPSAWGVCACPVLPQALKMQWGPFSRRKDCGRMWDLSHYTYSIPVILYLYGKSKSF